RGRALRVQAVWGSGGSEGEAVAAFPLIVRALGGHLEGQARLPQQLGGLLPFRLGTLSQLLAPVTQSLAAQERRHARNRDPLVSLGDTQRFLVIVLLAKDLTALLEQHTHLAQVDVWVLPVRGRASGAHRERQTIDRSR